MTDGYIQTSPEHLAALCVGRAKQAILLTNDDPLQWFVVIPDLHRALNCALVAALRGTAGIGAYGPKLRAEWLNWFEESRTKKVPAPTSDRVESFVNLLERIQQPSPDLQGEPLQLSPGQLSDLEKLNALRGDIEHVKPVNWFLETAGLPRICAAAAFALSHLFTLPPVWAHLTEAQTEETRAALDFIIAFGKRARVG